MCWCYSDGFQEVNCCGCCIWSDLHVAGWILSEAHTILVIMVSIHFCHYLLLRRNPQYGIYQFAVIQVSGDQLQLAGLPNLIRIRIGRKHLASIR